MDSIEYTPPEPGLRRHHAVMGEITVSRRNKREHRQAKAERDNKPFREAEKAVRDRMPGRERE